jgi:hypothetical protein
MKMKRVAQVAIEVLVLMGIIVIGSIILGVTYINSHNKNIQISSDVSVVQGEVQKELQYTGTYNPSSVFCGNNICESAYDENYQTCPKDCASTAPPTVESDCTNVSAPTFSPASGSLTPASTINISHGNDTNCTGFEIYYTDTNNGTEPSGPTRSSTEYSNLIPVSTLANPSEGSSITLKMKAIVYADSSDGDDPNDVPSVVASVTYTVTKPYCFSGTGSGSGTQLSPKIICTAKELADVRNKLDGNYILGQDINLSPHALSIEDWYPQDRGWDPIKDFNGSFDGNGHKLLNNYIFRQSNNDIGIFGNIKFPATIKNLYVVDTNISAKNNVGALVGYNEKGTIENCAATGIISGNNNLGGLIGLSREGSIINSFADTNVTGKEGLGGLIGKSSNTKISDCFSRGAVSGTKEFAGLIGNIENNFVINSYSTGLVSLNGLGPEEKNAGLIKKNIDATIINSYWDKETSRQDQSAGGEGKTTADMKNKHTFVNWEFVNIWAIDPGINNSYPYLINNLIIKTE